MKSFPFLLCLFASVRAPSADGTGGGGDRPIEIDDRATWAPIRVTAIISSITMGALLLVFEIARRHPATRNVYDRKRLTRPHRTPPPLMTGGWTFWCEWLFLSTDEEYAEYSRAVDRRKRARRRRREDRILRDQAARLANDAGGETGGDGAAAADAAFANEDSTLKGDGTTSGEGDDYEEDDLPPRPPYYKYFCIPRGSSGVCWRWLYLWTRRVCGMKKLPKKEEEGTMIHSAIKQAASDRQAYSLRRRAAAEAGGEDEEGGIDKAHEEENERGRPHAEKLRSRMTKQKPFYAKRKGILTAVPLPLTASDKELLRCIGLDSYVMIRFIRFGFDITFYPFLLACAILVPTYYTNDYDPVTAVDQSSDGGNGFSTSITNGYFRITINRLEAGSNRIWVVWAWTIAFYLYVLRRWWVEWMTFVVLRRDFLANGDPDTVKENSLESLKQYRNTCLVEYIPATHQTDSDLFHFYDTLFPGKISKAEVLINSIKLRKLIYERQYNIEQYENANARKHHNEMMYRTNRHNCICCKPKEPQPLQISLGGTCCFGGKMVEAMPHYLSEIQRLNPLIEEEYQKLVRQKKAKEASSVIGSQREFPELGASGEVNDEQWTKLQTFLANTFIPQELVFATESAVCDTGFVEFETRATKQAATQTDLTGDDDWMVTQAAPDPRDIDWGNVTYARSTIKNRKLAMEIALIVGLLFWGALITLIQRIDLSVEDEENSTIVGLIGGYLPALLQVVLLFILPFIFLFLGQKVIRFKSMSENDRWAFKWNVCYHIANFVVVIISGTLWDITDELRKSPETVIREIAEGILTQSQFFLSQIITYTGQGLSLQMFQPPPFFVQVFLSMVVSLDALSQRKLERMKEPMYFMFARFSAPFIYGSLIAIVYSSMVPLILGACGVYFFLATKVFTHQTLFVFSQRYEGGGKFMYLLNRTLFISFYVSIIIFTAVVSLKELPEASASFFAIMIPVTIWVDRRVYFTFIEHSLVLPLSRAIILDIEQQGLRDCDIRDTDESFSTVPGTNGEVLAEQYSCRDTLLQRGRSTIGLGIGQPPLTSPEGTIAKEEEDFFLYRQPDLNKMGWETRPQQYRFQVFRNKHHACESLSKTNRENSEA